MPRTNSAPSYRFHKARNCAVVTIDGKNHYLGPYHSPESFEKYNRLIAERRPGRRCEEPSLSSAVSSSLSINELILRYLEFASSYYVKHGAPTGETHNIRGAVRTLKRLFGGTPVADFTPKSLELVRQAMIDDGLSRKTINGRVGRIKRMFRWGTPDGLVPPATYHAPTAVAGLKQNRTSARETGPVTTVPDDIVRATLSHLSAHVRAMAQVQELTGMRPQEIRNLRACDLDMATDVWIYVPWTHKTEHHGHARRIAIGPLAQAILKPFLKPEMTAAYTFSPKEAVAAHKVGRSRVRESARTPDETGHRGTGKTSRVPGDQYSKDSSNWAIRKACLKAGVEPWSPNQLRHNCATKVRRLYGLDAAAAVLGHRMGTVTEIYAEADFQKAIEVMKQVG